MNKSDIEILTTYNAEVMGMYNFYSITNNVYKIGRFANLMKYSIHPNPISLEKPLAIPRETGQLDLPVLSSS